jgi:hypothetical protein
LPGDKIRVSSCVRSKCSYRGNIYVYEPFTIDEIEAKRLELLRFVNKKEFFIAILDKLRF